MCFFLVGRLLNNQANINILKDEDIDAHLEELDDDAIDAMLDELENFNEVEASEAEIILLENDVGLNQELSTVLCIRRIPCTSHKVS